MTVARPPYSAVRAIGVEVSTVTGPGELSGGGGVYAIDGIHVLSRVALPFAVPDLNYGNGRLCRVARLPG
ncbi:hypothetical protein GCM10020254_30700 [Streptomyces goshikiensis]